MTHTIFKINEVKLKKRDHYCSHDSDDDTNFTLSDEEQHLSSTQSDEQQSLSLTESDEQQYLSSSESGDQQHHSSSENDEIDLYDESYSYSAVYSDSEH